MSLPARLAALLVFAALPAAAFPPSLSVEVVEYVNEITGHYVLIARTDEQAVIDRGGAGPGWKRTGQVITTPFSGGGSPVCRFYSPRYNSHFFTASAAECELLKAPGSDWIYEEISFQIPTPTGGPIAPCFRDVPVRRLYNNRHAQSDANHRFTADVAVIQAMVADGWTDEGIAFCAAGAGFRPELSIEVRADRIEPAAGCESRVGGCVTVAQLAAMNTGIPRFFPPSYVVRNDQFPAISDFVLGRPVADLYTARPSAPEWSTSLSPQMTVPALPSFVQYHPSGTQYGLYINGTERAAGPYAGITPMHQLPGVAGTGGDERVFPWRVSGDRQLVVRTELSVGTLERLSAASHAYAHPIVRFADSVSGRSFYVTLQAFGSIAPGDFTGPDAVTGRAIVSTVFRADPAFGQRIAGDYAQCPGGRGVACLTDPRPFTFGLRRADFQQVLARARTVDPALSADPASYFVASFGLHAETYLDALLGVNVYRLGLELWYAGRYEVGARF